jgi:hypothetical protein
MKRRHLIQILAGALEAPWMSSRLTAAARETSEVFENKHLRVVRFRFEPGVVVATHYVLPSLMVYLTDSDARFTDDSGTSWEEKAQAGQVRWWPGGKAQVELLSNHRIEFLQVIPK